jgi:molybdopterin/thiamine biosynthesis adenylyltransferase
MLSLNVQTQTRRWDETFRLMSWWDSDRIATAKVMVVGAGALGNEVLKNLALLNIGHILVVDFDTIEYANLCRSILFRAEDCIGEQRKSDVAASRIREINPNIKVQSIHGDILLDIGLGVFRRMDVVIGCLDNRLARLFINQFCYKVNKTWVDGAIENLAGQLDVYKPGVSCYECQLSPGEREIIRYRLGCPDVARRNAAMGKIATTPISASIIGAMQVQEALKVIYGNERQSLAGQHFKYEGMHNMYLQYPIEELKEECESHHTIDAIIDAQDLSCKSTVKELMEWVIERFKDPKPIVQLGFELVKEVTTEKSEISFPVLIPKFHLSEKVALKYCQIPGEDLRITAYTSVIDHDFPDMDIPLFKIGIPPLQILKVEAGGAYYFVELSGDENFLNFQ